jgi:hypothetical protein
LAFLAFLLLRAVNSQDAVRAEAGPPNAFSLRRYRFLAKLTCPSSGSIEIAAPAPYAAESQV